MIDHPSYLPSKTRVKEELNEYTLPYQSNQCRVTRRGSKEPDEKIRGKDRRWML